MFYVNAAIPSFYCHDRSVQVVKKGRCICFDEELSAAVLGAGDGEAHGGSGIEAAAFLFCCCCNFNVLNLNARVQSRSLGVAPELDERLKNSRMR